MRISASDPDIETLVGRIRRGELNLRPDFQRGEVWPEAKRQRLIDTIMRGWQVPPIHVVSVTGTAELEVLDGQQRLAAVRDFAKDLLTINGRTEPASEEIRALDRCTFSALLPNWQRKFNQYPIRVFTITEYEPDEPYELFYRLNQPTTLTSAEQRNAFFGKAREQIKELVQIAQASGLNKDSIGFSNARMTYDDVLARACMFREAKTFRARVTAAALNDRYRSDVPFADSVIESVRESVGLFALALRERGKVRLNMATFLSWILFCCDNSALNPDGALLAEFIGKFESRRKNRHPVDSGESLVLNNWLSLFDDRASSRVNDTLSVVSRDFVLWLVFAALGTQPKAPPRKLLVAQSSFASVVESAEHGEYVEPAKYVQHLLDTRGWDFV